MTWENLTEDVAALFSDLVLDRETLRLGGGYSIVRRSGRAKPKADLPGRNRAKLRRFQESLTADPAKRALVLSVKRAVAKAAYIKRPKAPKPHKPANCHPEKRHYAKGLCGPCYAKGLRS